MSIELDVEIPDDASLAVATWESDLRLALRSWFDTADADLLIEASTSALGPFRWELDIRLGADARVRVSSLTIGSRAEFGDDGGWWITVAAYRTDESVALMLVVAARLAEILHSRILDDSSLLGAARFVQAAEAEQLIAAVAQRPFAEAAAVLARELEKRTTP
jgi:hypothetical protein